MAYTNVWNESTPTSATVANTIGDVWTTNMKAIRERFDDIFGTSGPSSIATADPYKLVALRMTGAANTYIIGGTSNWAVRDQTAIFNNFLVTDAGNISIRGTQILPQDTTIAFRNAANTFDNILIQDGGSIFLRNTVNISTGGMVVGGTISIAAGQAFVLEYNAGNITGATGINFSNGNNQRMVLTGNTTLTFSNAFAGGVYILRVKQDATGSRLVTWTGVTWAGGVAPTLTTTANFTDIITLYQTSSALLGFIGALGFNA